MARDKGFRKGDRVVANNRGRTATWGRCLGTVTRRLSKTSVEVVWDETHFGDEMQEIELCLAGDEGSVR